MKKIIEVKNLSFSYQNLKVLDNVSFFCTKNEFLAVVGPLGSGKTTLIKLIAGLKKPDKGKVIFQGKNVEKPTRDIGLVFQKSNLLPWLTVWQNITLPLKLQRLPNKKIEKKGMEMINLVGLKKFKNYYPKDLSGGMTQLTALTRAFAADSKLLLLDEPFASLDIIKREEMNLELLKLWQQKQKTIIFITHSIEEAVFLANRALILSPRPGNIKADIKIILKRPRSLALKNQKSYLFLSKKIKKSLKK
jgi:NitT/TauT family transport system ATP-binding protein